MRIALIGATGNIGTEIAKEAVRRGHAVTAVVRNPDRIPAGAGLTAQKGDVNDPAGLAPILRGHDAVALSVHFSSMDPQTVIGAVAESGAPRLAVVGGAGSLLLPDGTRLIDSPDFPAEYKPEALAGAAFLGALKASDLDWTFLSPSAIIAPGERTGSFRLADDDLLVGEDGQSRISQADYAIAFVDELESPKHSRRRFTVGY